SRASPGTRSTPWSRPYGTTRWPPVWCPRPTGNAGSPISAVRPGRTGRSTTCSSRAWRSTRDETPQRLGRTGVGLGPGQQLARQDVEPAVQRDLLTGEDDTAHHMMDLRDRVAVRGREVELVLAQPYGQPGDRA